MKFKDQLISPNLKYKLKHIVGLPKLPRVLKYKKTKNKKKKKAPTLNNACQSLAESAEKFEIAEWPIHTCHIAPD